MSSFDAPFLHVGPIFPAPPRVDPSEARIEVAREDDDQPESLLLFWRRLSSCLLSTALHLVTGVVLAMLGYSLADDADQIVLTASVKQDQPEQLEAPLFAPLTEQSYSPSETLLWQPDDPGVADFGQVGDLDVGPLLGDAGVPWGREGSGRTTSGDGTGGATFFGVKARGNKFAFVVDGSLSMEGSRWEGCKRELLAAVGRLKPEQSFYVVLFNTRAHPMFSDQQPEAKPLPPTPENIARLRQWLDDFPLHSGTTPTAAMGWALGMQPDAVYFLTDGEIHDKKDFLEVLAKENHDRQPGGDADPAPKSTINTIGFGAEGGGTLQKIAKENGGTYQQVGRNAAPPPEKDKKDDRP